ncbi:MAG: CopG family transcriptional regulator [Symploca sp. SIO2C1]|nr:CopG family transcriptional regulator [Symploca sp. SIO2C1]
MSKKGNRFNDLFGAARRTESVQTPPPDKKVAKGQNPDYTRTTIYLPKSLHRQLKAAALEEEREMSEIVTELVKQWLYER